MAKVIVKGITIEKWHSPDIETVLAYCHIEYQDYQVVTDRNSYRVDVASKTLTADEMAKRLKLYAPTYALFDKRVNSDGVHFISFCPAEDVENFRP